VPLASLVWPRRVLHSTQRELARERAKFEEDTGRLIALSNKVRDQSAAVAKERSEAAAERARAQKLREEVAALAQQADADKRMVEAVARDIQNDRRRLSEERLQMARDRKKAQEEASKNTRELMAARERQQWMAEQFGGRVPGAPPRSAMPMAMAMGMPTSAVPPPPLPHHHHHQHHRHSSGPAHDFTTTFPGAGTGGMAPMGDDGFGMGIPAAEPMMASTWPGANHGGATPPAFGGPSHLGVGGAGAMLSMAHGAHPVDGGGGAGVMADVANILQDYSSFAAAGGLDGLPPLPTLSGLGMPGTGSDTAGAGGAASTGGGVGAGGGGGVDGAPAPAGTHTHSHHAGGEDTLHSAVPSALPSALPSNDELSSDWPSSIGASGLGRVPGHTMRGGHGMDSTTTTTLPTLLGVTAIDMTGASQDPSMNFSSLGGGLGTSASAGGGAGGGDASGGGGNSVSVPGAGSRPAFVSPVSGPAMTTATSMDVDGSMQRGGHGEGAGGGSMTLGHDGNMLARDAVPMEYSSSTAAS